MKSLPSGCWTSCRECQDRCIPCHGYGSKPVWMDGSAAERQELKRIKKAVKANLQNLRRGLKSRGDATNTGAKESLPPPRQAETQTHTQPAQEAAEHPSLSPLEHVADNACTVSEGPNTPADARHTRHSLQEEEPARSPIPSCDLQPKSAALIMYYLDRVFHWQFPYFRLGSPMGNRGWLLLFLANGGSLTYAALALSTLHQNALQPQRQRDCYNEDALRFHSKALRELCEVSQHTETRMLLSDKLKLAEFVAASLTLISFEVFNGAEYDWLPHLDAVTAILSMYEPESLFQHLPSPAGIGCGSSHRQSQSDFDFFVAEALWFDILACVSTGRVPRIPYNQWLEGSSFEMADLMGCYNWVMVAIGDLAHLQTWKNHMKEEGRLSVPELVRKGQDIEKRLRDGITELEQIAKSGSNIPQATWVSHIFALGSLVLSSTIVSGPWPSLPEIKDTVCETVDILRDWPGSIPLQGLVWPLYIVGCMAEGDHQIYFHSLLSRMSQECGGFGNISTVLKILKSRWNSNRDGIELNFETGGNVMLV
ncbi:hypothetical protein FIE12Z_9286 [Fusarium flagelliforme]|uniref:C6 transcription factor n=1 Tax=Fusarium flagelliforme TaxID=2675880 RepID=A0A395MF28_9HYPO|nr:hypothetical protein FIE12Z_9286 [Fusarium flagelliforme]